MKKIIVIDDDVDVRMLITGYLRGAQPELDIRVAADGAEGWDLIQGFPADIVICDWLMPGIDGLELCRRIRRQKSVPYRYLLLLSVVMRDKATYMLAVDAGVDDFLCKPIVLYELEMRLRVADRVLRYMAQLGQGKEMIPICATCKSIRDDANDWQTMEKFISARMGTDFTHGICPNCMGKVIETFHPE